jgi:hypothetical protein
MRSRTFYLAYGSNLHPLRLGERVPSAAFEAVATLPGRRLVFDKRGQDGSGKCNLAVSTDPTHRVLGAVYSLDAAEVPLLDRFEGAGYRHQALQVVAGNRRRSVFAYVAAPQHCDPGLKPFSWYRELVYVGARYHGFPAGYLQELAAIETIEDRDPHRQDRHRVLLAMLASGASGG